MTTEAAFAIFVLAGLHYLYGFGRLLRHVGTNRERFGWAYFIAAFVIWFFSVLLVYHTGAL